MLGGGQMQCNSSGMLPENLYNSYIASSICSDWFEVVID